MIVHGEVFRPEQLNGFITEDWSGVITYYIKNNTCEIISLNSLKENRGVGRALIDKVENEARKQNCQRYFLSPPMTICMPWVFINAMALSWYAFDAVQWMKPAKSNRGFP